MDVHKERKGKHLRFKVPLPTPKPKKGDETHRVDHAHDDHRANG